MSELGWRSIVKAIVNTMAKSSKRERKKGRVSIEPLVFRKLPEVIREHIRRK